MPDDKEFDAHIDRLIQEANEAETDAERDAIHLQIENSYKQRGL